MRERSVSGMRTTKTRASAAMAADGTTYRPSGTHTAEWPALRTAYGMARDRALR